MPDQIMTPAEWRSLSAESRFKIRLFEQSKEQAEVRAERLEGALEKDQTGLAVALGKVRAEAKARLWVIDGRGRYKWDDERYRLETGVALQAIIGLTDRALQESGNLVQVTLADQPAQEGKPAEPAGGK